MYNYLNFGDAEIVFKSDYLFRNQLVADNLNVALTNNSFLKCCACSRTVSTFKDKVTVSHYIIFSRIERCRSTIATQLTFTQPTWQHIRK